MHAPTSTYVYFWGAGLDMRLFCVSQWTASDSELVRFNNPTRLVKPVSRNLCITNMHGGVILWCDMVA